jgi:hypothetical protein
MARAQSALEYTLLVAFGLAAVAIGIALTMNRVQPEIAQAQLEQAVDTLITTANNVALTGPGTVKLVWITVPPGVHEADISGRHISVNFTRGGNKNELSRLAQANLTGTFPASHGSYQMKVEMLDTGLVRIGVS